LIAAAQRNPAVPAGYAIERERGAVVVALPSVLEDVLSRIRTSGTLYDAAASAGGRAFTGRGAAYRLTLPDADSVVRHYRRGGMVARVLTDSYLSVGAPRTLHDLSASITACTRGVATPEVVAAVVYPAGLFYRADIATRYIPDGRDLAEVVLGETRGHAEARIAAWRATGVLLSRVFAAGVEHADLNMRNILITAERAWLLDLDRAVVHEREVSDVARSRMLARLERSRRKIEAATGRAADTEELAAFTEGLSHG